MTNKKQYKVGAGLSEDQYNLVRRRLFIEDLSWQTVIRALLNAYITGDVSVTAQGRYHLSPPSHHIPVMQIEGSDVEIEPEWTVKDRPQVGHKSREQKPREKPMWGTRELAAHLRELTGRKVSTNMLRKLLKVIDVPKHNNGGVWKFPGNEDNEHIPRIVEAFEEGVYDSLIYEGTANAEAVMEARLARESYKTEAQRIRQRQKRLAHLRRLRQTERESET